MNGRFYKNCVVPMCNSNTASTPEKLFISVPRNNMRKKWLQLARKDPRHYSIQSRMYFCQDHFDIQNDMENYTEYQVMGSVTRIHMKSDCLPRFFHCQADRIRRTSNITTQPCAPKRQRIEISATRGNKIEQPSCSTQSVIIVEDQPEKVLNTLVSSNRSPANSNPRDHPGEKLVKKDLIKGIGKLQKFFISDEIIDTNVSVKQELDTDYVTDDKIEYLEDEDITNISNNHYLNDSDDDLNDEETSFERFMESDVVKEEIIHEAECVVDTENSSNRELGQSEDAAEISSQASCIDQHKEFQHKEKSMVAAMEKSLMSEPSILSIGSKNKNTINQVQSIIGPQYLTHQSKEKDESPNFTIIPGVTYEILSFHRKLLASLEYSYNIQQAELFNKIDQMTRQAKVRTPDKVEIFPNSKIYLPRTKNIVRALSTVYNQDWHVLVAFILDEIYGDKLKHMGVNSGINHISIDKNVLDTIYSLVVHKSSNNISISLFNAMVNKICTFRRQT